jgi:hypothetical protein
LIALLDDVARWQLAGLAHHDEPRPEEVGQLGADEEAACVERRHRRHLRRALLHLLGQRRHGLLAHERVLENRRDVLEHDARLRKIAHLPELGCKSLRGLVHDWLACVCMQTTVQTYWRSSQ